MLKKRTEFCYACNRYEKKNKICFERTGNIRKQTLLKKIIREIKIYFLSKKTKIN